MTHLLPTQAARRLARRRLLAQDLGDAGEGIHPAQARPRVVRHDHHDPAGAADAVRLRHQHHAARSADRGAAAGKQRSVAFDPGGAAEHQVFQGHPAAAQRSRGRSTARFGNVLFAIEIPANFERSVRRGDKPAMLVAADATDPVASGSALSALGQVLQTALSHDRDVPDAPRAAVRDPHPRALQSGRR